MKTVLFARISDNVLDPEDWPVRRLVIEDDRVVDHNDVTGPGHGRAYGFDETDPQTGWTLDQLLVWSSRDTTGQHPETYYELKAEDDARYSSVYRPEQLDRLINGGYSPGEKWAAEMNTTENDDETDSGNGVYAEGEPEDEP